MEQNAPNVEIGSGTLVVRPEMQAVHDEQAKIEKKLDEIEQKAAHLFDSLPEQIRKASDAMDGLARKFEGLNFDGAVKSLEGSIDSFLAKLRDAKVGQLEQKQEDPSRTLAEALNERDLSQLFTDVRQITENVGVIMAQSLEAT